MTGPLPYYVLIVHEVDSYPAWKVAFDAAEGLRKAAGELSFQLLRDDADDDQVVHLSAWTTLDAARAFFESPEVQAIRDAAGVQAPTFHYLRELESRAL